MTISYQIIYWRDIPAQVKVRAGRNRVSRPLSVRFERAIDRAAMYAGKIDSDDYLAEWHGSDWQQREGEPEAVADALVSEIEAAYTDKRLRAMARNGGYEVKEEEVEADQD